MNDSPPPDENAPADSPPRLFRVLMVLALLAVHVGMALFVSGDFYGDIAKSMLFGVVLAQRLFCAAWAAWAPQRIFVRLPLAGFLLVGQMILASQVFSSLEDFAVLGGEFLLFLLIFSGLRRFGGWRLVAGAGPVPDRSPETRQFSIREVLVWMTVSAVFMGLGSLLKPVVGLASDEVDEAVRFVVIATGAFSILQLPAVAGLTWALGRKMSWRLIVLCLPLVIAAAAPLAAAGLVFGFSNGLSGFERTCFHFAAYAVGGTLAAVVSGLMLRLAGYRLTRGVANA